MKERKSVSQTQNDPGEYEFDCGERVFPITRKATLAPSNAQGKSEDDGEDSYLKDILKFRFCYFCARQAVINLEFDDCPDQLVSMFIAHKLFDTQRELSEKDLYAQAHALCARLKYMDFLTQLSTALNGMTKR